MTSLLISETMVNATKGYRFGESEPYEPFDKDVGNLFRSLQKEYGRCVSPVCVDTPSGAKRCGWVFHKRMRYNDARTSKPDDFYTCEVWVNLYESCEPDDPDARVTKAKNGAITRHPFKTKYLGDA